MALVILALSAMVIGSSAASAGANHHGKQGRNFLMVHDPGEKQLFFYKVPRRGNQAPQRTGTLRGVDLGVAPAHGGTVALPDGRILMNDEAADRTLAVRLNKWGKPKIVDSVSTTLGDEVPWTAVSPDFRYYAVPSRGAGSATTEFINLIDLKTFENTRFEITQNDPDEDLHPYLAGGNGKPRTLFVATGGLIQAFRVSDVLDGLPTTPTSSSAIGASSHGQFISPATKTLGITTANGLDVIGCGPFCSSLRSRATVSWDASGLTGGRSFRPRLGFDGKRVLNPIGVAPTDPAAWAQTRQELHVTNLKRNRARRIFLGNGASQRPPTSARYSVHALVHPKGDPRGDELKLIDVRPQSSRYLRVDGTAKLEQLTNGPVAGMPTTGKERRFAAVTPDGRYAFATHGGDGKVSMVNTSTLKVTRFPTPTALRGGGYATAFQVGFEPVDLMGR